MSAPPPAAPPIGIELGRPLVWSSDSSTGRTIPSAAAAAAANPAQGSASSSRASSPLNNERQDAPVEGNNDQEAGKQQERSQSRTSSHSNTSSSSEESEDEDDSPATPRSNDSDDTQGEEDEGVSYLANELKDEQALLKSRGLAPHRPPLALALDHLSVRGEGGSGVLFAPTVGSTFAPWSGAQDKRRLRKLEQAKGLDEAEKGEGKREKKAGEENLKKGERFLIHDVSLVLHPSEMLLVVGRPGSGCTTLLKSISGLRSGYAGVDGEVMYGSMKTTEPKSLRPYKAAVCFNSEDDIHFPNLSVRDTLDFAFAQKTPSPEARRPVSHDDDKPLGEKEYNAQAKARLLKVFGLEHTEDTPVGDEYVRGVSGGEKKRVSIAEVLANRASIQCWDNATRGLDANTALAFTKALRTYADLEQLTAAVSLYQAGNGIYDQFDKVLVLADGQVIFYGRREAAKKYFEEMGFDAVEGANVADYLTGTTVPKERQVRDGFEGKIPQTIDDFAKRYRESDVAKEMRKELDDHLANMEEVERQTTEAQEAIQAEKHKGAIMREPHVRGLWAQTRIAMRREVKQRWGDKWTFWARQGTTFIQAFVVGSLFYNLQNETSDIFLRGGTLYLSILFPSLISLSETTAAFEGRAILAKHKGFSLFRPSAVFLAQTVVDLPIFAVQTFIFCLIIFFLSHLKQTAASFFIYLLFTFATTVCTTSFFRLIGAGFSTFQNASKVSGLMFSVWVTYAGYVIQEPQMKPWLGWIKWVDPVFYAFEAVMASEFTGVTYQCSMDMTVPAGPTYQGGNAGCTMAGSTPGSTQIEGTAYLAQALSFYYSDVWRNLGIIIAMWIFFCAVNVIAVERLPAAGSAKSVLMYKRGGGKKFIQQQKEEGSESNEKARPIDNDRSPNHQRENDSASGHERRDDGDTDNGDASSSSSRTIAERQNSRDSQDGNKDGDKDGDKDGKKKGGKKDGDIESADAVFTWKDLTYTVGNNVTLLNKVSGYCKAGELTALMGSSGAGKTTLMDVLAGRKDEGEIKGEILFQGKPLPISFTRTTGYCEQQDVHLPQASVREALEFSARLRQPRTTPDKERIAYVDEIIELLELHDIEDAIIGVPGAGLGIEQRKRLTIAVELVAKPSILFLDEPTSGLDGQSSFIIVSFLKKLVKSGQAVLCTIHQPSASLFKEFDNVLLLKSGGRVAYFGAVDKLPAYFKGHGAKIPKGVNPAEAMIDILQDAPEGTDWADTWDESDESKKAMETLEKLKEAGSKNEVKHEGDGDEFASTTIMQLKLVTHRATTQLWRDTEYVTNKVALHISSALFNGFSFWMIGNSYGDLQLRLFTIFQFIFVAPGVIAQVQPKFIANRDIFEAREKKAKIYSWRAFILGEITAEIPYLLVCAFLYWACWYAVVGFSFRPEVVGPVYLQMTLYEFLYTGIGQMIAAYSPNAVFAALVNPLVISVLVTFSGVLVPYPQITAFWRYWLYYLNPFTRLLGGMLVFPIWDVQVQCKMNEMAIFDPPAGSTCGDYLQAYLANSPPGYLDNPAATESCMYCPIQQGSEYLAQRNLYRHIYGWRDICLTLLFCISSYACVFVLMKLRSRSALKA